MKTIPIILLLLTGWLLSACEDVVEADLSTAPPRLVIDASIDWIKNYGGEVQLIKLTTTTGFYDTYIPVVSNATVYITNSTGIQFDFIEDPGTGKYYSSDFEPVLLETYTLTVIHNGETYTATESLIPTPDIQEIIQTDEGITDDFISLKTYFQDPPELNNRYMDVYTIQQSGYIYRGLLEDTFFNGNYAFSTRMLEDTNPGDKVMVQLYGISESYYNYMRKILSVSSPINAGPFSTPPPSAIHGNIINTTNIDNYALGYFRLGEVSIAFHTVQ